MPRGRKRETSASTRGRPKSTKCGVTGNLNKGLLSAADSGSSLFDSENVVQDVFQEVEIADEEVLNVENSRSNSPVDSNSNSVSSYSEAGQYWTREDLTPSEAPPDNLFTDEDIKTFGSDLAVNFLNESLSLNDGPGFSIGNLFSVKEEGVNDPAIRIPECNEETTKKSTRRKMKQEISEDDSPAKIQMMSLYEEQTLYRQLRLLADKHSLTDPQQRRLYRKLCLRNTRRSLAMEQFNFDCVVAKLRGTEYTCSVPKSDEGNRKVISVPNVLDRLQKGHLTGPVTQTPLNISFRMRLLGTDENHFPQPVVSPYTGRVLKPFIRRDYESRPVRLQLLQEIRAKCDDLNIRDRPCLPIDYVYVQPHHIPAVNAICREFFWAGIDVSECLEYPDFSCVVLYGQVVIGFAFMVPDVSYNEAYVSYIFTHPEWRSAGIGKFMLYHLIQSCMGKDVTLHVSATNNSALNLYHRFGFKVQEFVGNFYDKYLPADSTQCKDAFFMRLTR